MEAILYNYEIDPAFPDAVRAAAVNPARAIGIYSRCGSLEPGKRANVVILDERLELKDVFFRGELVRGEG